MKKSQGMAESAHSNRIGLRTFCLLLGVWFCPVLCRGEELNRDHLLSAVRGGRRELVDRQLENGAFPADGFLTHPLGTTCLATLALIKTSTTENDPAVRLALKSIRSQPWSEANRTHEIALGIMVLVCNGHPDDLPLIEQLTRRLVETQTTHGGWTHQIGLPEGDLSISYFALLALREATRVGVKIPPSVFEQAQHHWLALQNADGGWFDFAFERGDGAEGRYTDASTFTATLAGITALATCRQMLQLEPGAEAATAADCPHALVRDEASQRALNWLQTSRPPGLKSQRSEKSAMAFHLYGLELCNRMRGPLHPREREWYLEGARSLLASRNPRTGVWEGTNDVIATSHALLYLSVEIAPALIHRLQLESSDTDNPHPHDVWNLTEELVRRRGWQRCLTARDVTLSPEIAATGRIAGALTGNFRDVPVLFLTGEEPPQLSKPELATLREYLDRGGVLFASPGRNRQGFEQGFLELLGQLNPTGSTSLTQLPADHPVYQSHFPLTPDDAVIYGVETGCRTAIFYCRQNLACHWESAASHRSPHHSKGELGVRIGANVLACALGDMVPTWPEANEFIRKRPQETAAGEVDRSLLQVAQLQHGRSWNTAPRALTRLMQGVNAVHGPTVALTPRVLTLDSPDVFDHMLLSLHGSHSLTLGAQELDTLRQHLQRGGVLFADACCGSKEFDASFRRLTSILFPGKSLQILPVDHELFSLNPAYELRKVKLRLRQHGPADDHSTLVEVESAPLLEGLEIDGRLAVLYSRYDLSCVLEGPGRIQCEGYLPEDALKIGVNIILYALVQDYRPPELKP